MRGATIISAPLALSDLSIELAGASIFFALKSIVDLIMLNPAEALADLKTAGHSAYATVAFAVAAIISSLVNAVDLIGSGITTLAQNSEEVEEHSSTNCFV